VRLIGPTRGPQGWVLPLRRWGLARIERVPGPGGDLLAGVLLGDGRRLAQTATAEDFRACGLTHLVAVSGGHLAVVAACVLSVLSLTRTRPWPRALAVALLCGGYVALTGVQASAVRSWLMALVLAAALAGGRRGDPLAALAGAAALMLAVDPSAAFDLGFRLSVLSVAALVAFARLTSAWLLAALPRPARGLAPPLAASLTAQAATTPLCASAFGALSLVAPLANLLAGPAVALALVLGGVGLAVAAILPPGGDVVLHLAGALLAATAALASHLGALPFASVPVAWGPAAPAAFAVAAAGVWAWWPAPDRRGSRWVGAGAALLMLAVFAWPASSGPEIVVLDVGQGDAILVRDGGSCVLVDGGPSGVGLRRALGRHRVRRIDAAVATHLHADHAAGISGLGRSVPLGALYVPPGCTAADLERALPSEPAPRELRVGDVIRCGSWSLRALWPPPGRDPNENDGCLVLLAQRPGERILLTGDAESDVLDELARAGRLPDVDVLKVGHHGSRDAVSARSLRALTPAVALISVGAGNRFGHPTPQTLADLTRAGVPVLRTDLVGDITIREDGGAIRVTTGHAARYNAPARDSSKGSHVLGTEIRLPALWLRGPARGSRCEQHPHSLCRASRPRFQPHAVRRGERERRRDHRSLQHDAVSRGPPPRDRQKRRQALDRRREQARRVLRRPVAVRVPRAGGREVSQGLEALQGGRRVRAARFRQGVRRTQEVGVPCAGARDVL
jgi:competence protein ComEC